MEDVVTQQTAELLKAASRLQDVMTMIHYDLWAIIVLVFAFGMIIAFKRRRP